MKNQIKITKWTNNEILRTREIALYIKPTRYIHDSGFRTFEVGYCKIGGNNKVVEKMPLGSCSDHIGIDNLVAQNKDIDINLDLTRDGYIRIFSEFKILWDNNNCLSTMRIINYERE